LALPPASEEERFARSIRANVVFEKLIVSVLTVALVSGLAHLLISLGVRLAGAGLSLAGVVDALFAAFSFSVMFFLAGFAASAAIGIPLHFALERAKIRKIWPFALAFFAVGLAILSPVGLAPGFAAPWNALLLVPGLAVALLFGRKMQGVWRAAERAEEVPPVFTLH
jgi:hypothetical protein